MAHDPYTIEEQEDLRGILTTLRDYLKTHEACKEAEVLVGPTVASIVVPIGRAPVPEGMDETTAMRLQDEYSRRLGAVRFFFREFYIDWCSGYSPLIQFTEVGEEHLVARYRLVPNDPIGCERELAKTIKRLTERHAHAQTPAVA